MDRNSSRSHRELVEIRKRYEPATARASSAASRSRFFRSNVLAFSVLGRRNGEWVCLIFIRRPTTVNDRETLQLGHELAHCLLGQYHRP